MLIYNIYWYIYILIYNIYILIYIYIYWYNEIIQVYHLPAVQGNFMGDNIIQQSNMMTNMWICICPVIFGQQKPCRSGSHQKSQNIPPSSHTSRFEQDAAQPQTPRLVEGKKRFFELQVQVADGWIVIEMSPSRVVFGCGYKLSIALVLCWFPPMKRLPSRKPTLHYGSHAP